MKRLLTVAAVSLVLSGCAATGESYSSMSAPNEGKAKLYVLRDSNFIGGGLAFTIFADDTKIGVIRNNGYFDADIEADEVEVWGEGESKRSVVIKAEAGKTYCVRVDLVMGMFSGSPSLSEIPFRRCRAALVGKKRSR